jgi:hypothetical protein
VALPLHHPCAADEAVVPAALAGLLAHLDTIYGFALTLTGAPEPAADLTERVFDSARDELWATLGGHGLRDRLLARCVAMFRETPSAASPRPASGSGAVLAGLPWEERVACALVDQMGLTYAAGAAVLGIEVVEFRGRLHRARAVLLAAYCEDRLRAKGVPSDRSATAGAVSWNAAAGARR